MANSKFRYEIVVTDNVTNYNSPIDVFDLTDVNDPSFVLIETREKDKMYYTKKIKNNLIVGSSFFTYFRTNKIYCRKYWVNIYKRCEDGEVFIYRAFFSDKNISYNLDKCYAEIELQDKSPYNCFNNKRSQKVDVYGGSQTANLFLYTGPTLYRSADWGQTVLLICSSLNCCDEFGCYYPLVSDFFNWQKDGFGATIFPDDQAMTNYVNPLQPNYYLRIAAKSDIKNPTASNPAGKLMMSFDDVEKIMQELFNVFWVIEDYYLRWEHYSYFTQMVNYDAISATNFPLNKLKNQVKYSTEALPSTETFEMMEANSVDFVGLPIIYDDNCSNGENKERGYVFVTTETDYIINNSSSIANEGFVLIDCFKVNATPEWYVYTDIGYLSGSNQKNGRLSWANLHNDLHKYGRPFLNGIMNAVSTAFFSKVPDIIQENILVNNCCEDEYEKWSSRVRTEIGDGIIDEAEIDFTKEQIKFKLRHDNF